MGVDPQQVELAPGTRLGGTVHTLHVSGNETGPRVSGFPLSPHGAGALGCVIGSLGTSAHGLQKQRVKTWCCWWV